MLDGQETRRGFLGRLAIALGGTALVPLLGAPAEARSRFRGGWGGWGGGGYRRGSGFRGFRGGYGWGGYGGGGYYPAPRYYAPRYYSAPYVRPYVAPAPRYYSPYYNAPGYYAPMMKNDVKPFTDALSLLEA